MQATGNISEILQSKPAELWCVDADASVYDAIHMMADKNIGALLVLERSSLIGVVSERDYTRKVALRGRTSKDTRVREIVSKPLIATTRDATVEDCMRLMTENRVRHLPVLEKDRIVGIVSIGDVVKRRIEDVEREADEIRNYIATA